MNNYLNEERIYKLINKIEKSVFYGDILSCKFEGRDVFVAVRYVTYSARKSLSPYRSVRRMLYRLFSDVLFVL